MQQFEIKEKAELFEIAGQSITFSNSALWMIVSGILIVGFFALTLKGKLVPGRLQSMGELSYQFIADMIRDTTGPEAMKFLPFVFTLFFFILAANLIGMNPYAFTTTSHLAVTVALAVMTIGIVIIAGIAKNGLSWFKIFAPSGLPFIMYFIIIPIEVISFIALSLIHI